jgi:hypothetical protein
MSIGKIIFYSTSSISPEMEFICSFCIVLLFDWLMYAFRLGKGGTMEIIFPLYSNALTDKHGGVYA